jgi:hypothetical protein
LSSDPHSGTTIIFYGEVNEIASNKILFEDTKIFLSFGKSFSPREAKDLVIVEDGKIYSQQLR